MSVQQKVVVIIQARMSSTRFPGKSLADLCGKPLVWHVVERARMAKEVDEVVLATTDDPTDTPLYDFAIDNRIKCFRGDLNDVLDRYYQAAKYFNASIIVRITGDSPLVDPALVDEAVRLFKKGGCDYAANSQEPWMDGFDVEVFGFSQLDSSWKEAKMASEREHVTLYLRNNPKFKRAYLKNDPWFAKLQLSVDRPEDLELIRRIYSEMLSEGKDHAFSFKDVKRFLTANPALLTLNKGAVVNEGLYKSLKEDKKVK